MDQRPIGLFDSGLGGLTAAKVLEEILPGENLVYFGDSANAPYGVRPREELLRLGKANAAFLCSMQVKAIIVACGTVSSTVIDEVRGDCPVPVFDVVEAACQSAAASGAGRIAVIATEATIRSGAFARRLEALSPGVEICSSACQSLVTTVERGHFCPGDPIAEAAVAKELAEVRDFRPELLMLACTHFPLLAQSISAFMGPEVQLVSVSAEAAQAAKRFLRREGLLAAREKGSHRWFTSGSTAEFGEFAEIFLGHKILPEKHVNTILT